MKSIKEYTLAMLLYTIEAQEVDPNKAQTMTYLNARFWIIVFFILLALVTGYKIAADNEPDITKDSILYAKFVQMPREKRHGE